MKSKQPSSFYFIFLLLVLSIIFFFFYSSWSKAKTEQMEHSNIVLRNQLRKECENDISKEQKYYDDQLHYACDDWKYLDKSYNINSYNDCVSAKLSEPDNQQIVNAMGAIEHDYQGLVQRCIDRKFDLVVGENLISE